MTTLKSFTNLSEKAQLARRRENGLACLKYFRSKLLTKLSDSDLDSLGIKRIGKFNPESYKSIQEIDQTIGTITKVLGIKQFNKN